MITFGHDAIITINPRCMQSYAVLVLHFKPLVLDLRARKANNAKISNLVVLESILDNWQYPFPRVV